MYGHKSDPTKVYKYGAKPPEGESDRLLYEQINGSWRYRNDLVALELERREEVEAILRDHAPDLVEIDAAIEGAEAKLDTLRGRIRAGNAKNREKRAHPRLRAEIREVKAERKRLYQERKTLRKVLFKDPAAAAQLDGLDAVMLEHSKQIRADSGLHWGTYLTVEQGLSGIRKGAPPRFVRRSDWSGQVAVQIQGGASWEELLDGHGQAEVEKEPLPPNAKPGGRRSKRPFHRLRIRVGSEGPGNRIPIWAEIRFVLHRPVPDDAQIKWVKVVRQMQGTDERWSVQFVLARDSWDPGDTHGAHGVCGVDLGWRMDAGDLRVAYIAGEDGLREAIEIPEEQYGRVLKADSLDSIRDRKLNLVRERFARWLDVSDSAPEWLGDETRTLRRWRSQARLAALVIRWRERRFAGDQRVYEWLEAWRKQDKHLYLWSAAERAGFRRWRKDYYRNIAARIRRRYECIVIEDTDWSELRQRPAAEDDTEPVNTRRMAAIAAPGELAEILRQGHPMVVEADAADTTRTCSICGSHPAHDWDPIGEISYRCVAGHRIDQDENAAINLMRSWASGDVVSR